MGTAIQRPGNQFGSAIRSTTDGGYVIVGTTDAGGLGGTDVFLMKTNAMGNVDWESFHGGSGNEQGHAVEQTQDGGYIVAGSTDSALGGGPGGIYLLKTDGAGVPQWQKSFGGVQVPKFSDTAAVRQTADGGYVVAGTGPGTEANPEPDAYLIRTDGDGNLLWQKTFGAEAGNVWAEGYAVRQTADGGFILAGFHEATSSYAVKTDASGNTQWVQAFGAQVGPLYSVEQTADGGYMYIGRRESGAGCAALLARGDASGQLLWTTTVGALVACSTRVSGRLTADGGTIIVTRGGAGNGDAYVVKADSSGIEQWARLYGGNGEDAASGVVQRSDGGYALTGHTRSFGSTSDVYFLRLDPGGNPQ